MDFLNIVNLKNIFRKKNKILCVSLAIRNHRYTFNHWEFENLEWHTDKKDKYSTPIWAL